MQNLGKAGSRVVIRQATGRKSASRLQQASTGRTQGNASSASPSHRKPLDSHQHYRQAILSLRLRKPAFFSQIMQAEQCINCRCWPIRNQDSKIHREASYGAHSASSCTWLGLPALGQAVAVQMQIATGPGTVQPATRSRCAPGACLSPEPGLYQPDLAGGQVVKYR